MTTTPSEPIHAMTDEQLSAQIVHTRDTIVTHDRSPVGDPGGVTLLRTLDLLCATVREQARREAAREVLAAEGTTSAAVVAPAPQPVGPRTAIPHQVAHASGIRRDDQPRVVQN